MVYGLTQTIDTGLAVVLDRRLALAKGSAAPPCCLCDVSLTVSAPPLGSEVSPSSVSP